MKNKKSKRRKIIFVSAGVVLVGLVIAGISMGPMLRETSKMVPNKTGAVIPGIYAIKDGYVNIYIMETGGKYVAIDAGSSASGIKKGLETLGISGDDVVAVLLTHTHGDHIGALSVFDKATIYGSADSKFQAITNKLSDGQKTEVVNISVQCISTPGHYSDSVCYLIDGKYLFSGDTLSLRDNKVGLFNSYFNDSDEQQKADIEKLSQIAGIQCIFTAHYGFSNQPIFK